MYSIARGVVMNERCSHVQLGPVVGGSPCHATLLSEQMLPVQHSMLHVFCSLLLFLCALSLIIQVRPSSATQTQYFRLRMSIPLMYS